MSSYLPKVVLKVDEGQLFVHCPFRESLMNRFRELGGKGSLNDWTFDAREKDRVAQLCDEYFGHHGDPVPLCDIRFNLADAIGEKSHSDKRLFLFGRLCASRLDRDKAPTMGEGVVVVEGRFEPSEGSKAHPKIGWVEGIVLEIRDVPVALVERWRANEGNARLEIVRVDDAHPLAGHRAKVEAAAKALETAIREMRDACAHDQGSREACDDALQYLATHVVVCYRDAY